MMAVRPIMGVYFKAKKTGNLVNFPRAVQTDETEISNTSTELKFGILKNIFFYINT